MKRNAFGLLALPCLAILTLSCPAQTVFNATTDFSVTNGNPNGVWTYGYMDTGFTTFTAQTPHTHPNGDIAWVGFHTDYTPTIWKNLTATTNYGVPPGAISLHPGPQQQPCVLRWTAPSGFSSAQVTGQFFPGETSGPGVGIMQVAVRKNGTETWHASDQGSFDLSVSLVAGDYLDFAVYGGYGGGNTPLQLTITAIPEPSTYAALAGLGALGFAVLRRRRERCV